MEKTPAMGTDGGGAGRSEDCSGEEIMSKILPSAIILALVIAIIFLAGSGLQQQQTTATLAQTTLEQGRALEANAINDVFQSLISMTIVLCGGMTLLIGGVAVAFWRMTTSRERQIQALIAQMQGGQARQLPGRWTSGPNAQWGRMPQQQQLAMSASPSQGQMAYLPYPQYPQLSQMQFQQPPSPEYYQQYDQGTNAMDGIYWEVQE
jgi:hypothetical protein